MRLALIATLALAFLAGCGKEEAPPADDSGAPQAAAPEGAKADQSGTGLRMNPNYKGN